MQAFDEEFCLRMLGTARTQKLIYPLELSAGETHIDKAELRSPLPIITAALSNL